MTNRKKASGAAKTVLVTGGAGFIGSHTAVELLSHGDRVIIVDNLYNAKPFALQAIRRITGKRPLFIKGDVANKALMKRIFREHRIDAVIHFAGYKAVGESVSHPLKYYRNNLDTTLSLLEAMSAGDCRCLVFSSSATVYARSEKMPLREDSPLGTSNPYGETKLMIEKILADVAHSDPRWSFICLRYFNPVGGHESGLLGEEPNGTPNNLMPYIVKVATGELRQVSIFGNDYPTPDGTGVRDYIHVVDLAKAHLAALKRALGTTGIDYINVGTGKGTSVLELIKAFEAANQLTIPYQIAPRRPGDLPEVWASTEYAKKALGFTATHSITEMCRDAYRFEAANARRRREKRR